MAQDKTFLSGHDSPPCDFFGRYRQKIAKGRITLPVYCRRAMPEGSESTFLLRQGKERCIEMIPLTEWQKLRARGGTPDKTGADRRWAQRSFRSEVEPAQLDPKGRFSAPDELLTDNGIKGEVLIVGVGRILELWNPDTFFAELKKHRTGSDEMDDLFYD